MHFSASLENKKPLNEIHFQRFTLKFTLYQRRRGNQNLPPTFPAPIEFQRNPFKCPPPTQLCENSYFLQRFSLYYLIQIYNTFSAFQRFSYNQFHYFCLFKNSIKMSIPSSEYNMNEDEKFNRVTHLKVDKHKVFLYNQLVSNQLNHYKFSLNNIDPISRRREFAEKEHVLINELIKGNIDKSLEELLDSLFPPKDWKKLSKKCAIIVNNRNFFMDNFDIDHPNCLAEADAIIEYKKFLSSFINQEEESKNKRDIASELLHECNEYHERYMEEYICDWVECRTTLNQWLKNPGSEVFERIDSGEDYSYETINKYFEHRDKLFFEYVDSKASDLIHKIKNIDNDEQAITCATRDLALIKDLIDGTIDNLKESRLKTTFSIKNWQKVHLQFDQIFRDLFDPYCNHDIFHEDSFADAQSILKYKEFLTTFITPKPEQDNLNDPLDFSFPLPPPVEIAKRQISNEEMEGLFQDWIAGRTTLSEWQSFPDSSVVNTFDDMASDDEYGRVLDHQINLYYTYVKNLTDTYITNFNYSSNPKIKLEKAQIDISLINDLINGNKSPAKEDLLFNVFAANDWELIHRQINYFIDKEGNPIYITTDIHNPNCLAIGESIFKYKTYLEEYLDSADNAKKDKVKATYLGIPTDSKNSHNESNGRPSLNLAYTLIKDNSLDKLGKKAFHDKISEHVKCLKDSGFLKDATPNIEYFIQIFRNKKPHNKIQWNKSKSSLSWYISELM